MPTVACHSCGLPRAAELVETAPCPVCGVTGGPLAEEVTPPADSGGSPCFPPPLAQASPAETGGSHPPPAKSSTGAAVGFLAGVAVGVAGVLGWQAATRTADPSSEPAGSRPPLARNDRAPEVAPPPREVVARGASPAESGGSRPPLAKNDPTGTGGSRPPLAQKGPAVMALDNPDGTASPHVRPGGSLTLRGRVKKLVVSGLEGGAVLDCSELDAAEVVVVGPIDGGSRLAVRCPNGRVRFLADAGIGGGAVVEVTAGAVELGGRIDGGGTRVTVRLTGDGALTFATIDGPARLEYGRSTPSGPEPSVRRGKEGPGSVVARLP